MASQTYELFGLTLESQLPLPDGLPAGSGTPDVRLRASGPESQAQWAALDDADQNDWFACRRLPDASTCLRWTGLFDFWISADGELIEYRKHRRASLESFTVYFLGQVLSFSLLARGIEPLHGSAVVVDGRAIVFLGACGAGKSTLAAAMIARGYPAITDDVVVLRPSENGWVVEPGIPRIKLFPATARKLLGARDATPMNTGTTKLVMPLAANEAVRGRCRWRRSTFCPRWIQRDAGHPRSGSNPSPVLTRFWPSSAAPSTASSPIAIGSRTSSRSRAA